MRWKEIASTVVFKATGSLVRIPNTDRYFFSKIFRSSIHVGLILSKKINMILI